MTLLTGEAASSGLPAFFLTRSNYNSSPVLFIVFDKFWAIIFIFSNLVENVARMCYILCNKSGKELLKR